MPARWGCDPLSERSHRHARGHRTHVIVLSLRRRLCLPPPRVEIREVADDRRGLSLDIVAGSRCTCRLTGINCLGLCGVRLGTSFLAARCGAHLTTTASFRMFELLGLRSRRAATSACWWGWQRWRRRRVHMCSRCYFERLRCHVWCGADLALLRCAPTIFIATARRETIVATTADFACGLDLRHASILQGPDLALIVDVGKLHELSLFSPRSAEWQPHRTMAPHLGTLARFLAVGRGSSL